MTQRAIMRDTTVEIDSSKFVVNGKTFAIRAIKAIMVVENRLTLGKGAALVLIIVSIPGFASQSVSGILAGLLLLVLGVITWRRSKKNYVLMMKTGALYIPVLKRKDRSYIYQVKTALEQAIAAAQ